MEQSIDRIIREEERRKVTGLSRTTWWRMERNGLAPKRRQLSANSVGWLESELRAWMSSKAQAA
jgi:prophage regulatory protein